MEGLNDGAFDSAEKIFVGAEDEQGLVIRLGSSGKAVKREVRDDRRHLRLSVWELLRVELLGDRKGNVAADVEREYAEIGIFACSVNEEYL